MKNIIFEIIEKITCSICEINSNICSDSEFEEILEQLRDNLEYLETMLELYYCDTCPASDLNISKYCGIMNSIGLTPKQRYYCKYHAELQQRIEKMKKTVEYKDIQLELKALKILIC